MTDNGSAVGNYFGCKVCCIRGVPFTNSSLSAHLQTKGHKFMKLLYEYDLWPEPLDKPANYTIKPRPYKFLDRNGQSILCSVCNKIVPGPMSLFEHQLEDQHQKIVQMLAADWPTVFHCDACNVMCYGLNEYYNHCLTKEHSDISEAKGKSSAVNGVPKARNSRFSDADYAGIGRETTSTSVRRDEPRVSNKDIIGNIPMPVGYNENSNIVIPISNENIKSSSPKDQPRDQQSSAINNQRRTPPQDTTYGKVATENFIRLLNQLQSRSMDEQRVVDSTAQQNTRSMVTNINNQLPAKVETADQQKAEMVKNLMSLLQTSSLPAGITAEDLLSTAMTQSPASIPHVEPIATKPVEHRTFDQAEFLSTIMSKLKEDRPSAQSITEGLRKANIIRQHRETIEEHNRASQLIECLNVYINEQKERIRGELSRLTQLETVRDSLLQRQMDQQRDASIDLPFAAVVDAKAPMADRRSAEPQQPPPTKIPAAAPDCEDDGGAALRQILRKFGAMRDDAAAARPESSIPPPPPPMVMPPVAANNVTTMTPISTKVGAVAQDDADFLRTLVGKLRQTMSSSESVAQPAQTLDGASQKSDTETVDRFKSLLDRIRGSDQKQQPVVAKTVTPPSQQKSAAGGADAGVGGSNIGEEDRQRLRMLLAQVQQVTQSPQKDSPVSPPPKSAAGSKSNEPPPPPPAKRKASPSSHHRSSSSKNGSSRGSDDKRSRR